MVVMIWNNHNSPSLCQVLCLPHVLGCNLLCHLLCTKSAQTPPVHHQRCQPNDQCPQCLHGLGGRCYLWTHRSCVATLKNKPMRSSGAVCVFTSTPHHTGVELGSTLYFHVLCLPHVFGCAIRVFCFVCTKSAQTTPVHHQRCQPNDQCPRCLHGLGGGCHHGESQSQDR